MPLNSEQQQELEDYVALLASPGWARFQQLADAEWGAEGYRRKARSIMAGLAADQTGNAANLLLQLESSSRAVEQLFGTLMDRVKRLQGREMERVTR